MDQRNKSLFRKVDEAVSVLSHYVIPIFSYDESRQPCHIGSGFFIQSERNYFLVSAAHVLGEMETRELFYYIEPNKTKQLVRVPNKDEVFDIGVLPVTEGPYPPYHSIRKIACDISMLRPRRLPRRNRYFAIVGFPGSKSKLNPKSGVVTSKAYAYHHYSIDDDEYETYGVKPESNTAIPFDPKIGFESSGKHRNFPKPHGMSGSPIWEMFGGEPLEPDTEFSIVAVGTHYLKQQQLMIGTDVCKVLELLQGG